MAVSAIVEVITSAKVTVLTTSALTHLIAEVIRDCQTDGAAVPTVLAVLPEALSPCGILSRATIQ